MNSAATCLPGCPGAGLSRRLAAGIYDVLLLAGVLFVAGLPLPLLPGDWLASEAGRWALRAYLGATSLAFFGWFWVHGGQTLGMRAWRLRVVRDDGQCLRWRDAVARFAALVVALLPLGLGVLWAGVDPQRRGWHDRLSGTSVVLLPRR